MFELTLNRMVQGMHIGTTSGRVQ